MKPRYRKVYPHMWDDAKVRALSRPPPNGQSLWVHLLTGEQTAIIPGVFKIGEAAFAEQLGWSLEGFREAFGEVFRQGMARADWKERLVWVPNGLKWNQPESPNVIRNWAESWRHLPECALKHEIWRAFKAFTLGLTKGFQEAFASSLPEPVISEQGAVNREQEEDPISETPKPKRERKPRTPSAPAASPTGFSDVIACWFAEFEKRYGEKPKWGGREGKQLQALMGTWPAADLLELVPYFFAWKRPEVIKAGHSFGRGYACFTAKIEELRADVLAPERRREAGAAVIQERQAEKSAANDDALAVYLEKKRNAS